MRSVGFGNTPRKKSGENQVYEMLLILQVSIFCGPEKENCVGNQTLKDESCLVSCTGLYADIVDDSFKQATQAFDQNVMKGRALLNFPLKTKHVLDDQIYSHTYVRFPIADSRATRWSWHSMELWPGRIQSQRTPLSCASADVSHLSRQESG